MLSGLKSDSWARLTQQQVGNKDKVNKEGVQDGASVSSLGNVCSSH